MLPAGYLSKRIVPPPGWLTGMPHHVTDVCSVSDCVNDDVVDVQGAWQHNGFGLANSPDVLSRLASSAGADMHDASLFYYTAYERELPSDGWTFDPADWRPRSPAASAGVIDDILVPFPATISMIGYDVVVFGDLLEHSPLSCNAIARALPVNAHCLLASLDEAIAAIEGGVFAGGCEEGAYTIFAVHRVD